jgi:hypothetical protein
MALSPECVIVILMCAILPYFSFSLQNVLNKKYFYSFLLKLNLLNLGKGHSMIFLRDLCLKPFYRNRNNSLKYINIANLWCKLEIF